MEYVLFFRVINFTSRCNRKGRIVTSVTVTSVYQEFVRSLKRGINVRKISGNAVTRLPHQTTQALMTSGEYFVISNPHTSAIGEIPLCQV